MRAARKVFLLLGFLVAISALLVASANKKSKSSVNAQLDETKRIVHALNRFTFGPRPGDADNVRALGLEKWFDQQLHPDRIDDSALKARVAPFRTLTMSTHELVENFPPPDVLRAVERGRMSMPSDSAKKVIYQSRIVALQDQEEKKQEKKEESLALNAPAAAISNQNPAQNPASDMPAPSMPASNGPARDMQAPNEQTGDVQANKDPKSDSDAAPAKTESSADAGAGPTPEQRRQRLERQEAAMYADLAADTLLGVPPEQRYKKILAMSPRERLDLVQEYRGPRAVALVDGMKPEQRETVQAIMNPQNVVGGELAQAKLLRAVYGERQLEEVMTDFWYNHFNVFIGKGPDRYMITAYERDVIRPHVFGKFKDLLVATAKSPAMLFYLDNWESVGPHSQFAVFGNQRPQIRRGPFGMIYVKPPRPQPNQNRKGLNENYAREIMELHTLGVDGGYTQQDVTELAKVFTGWSIDQPQRGGGFKYDDRSHEPGKKYVLGHKIGDHGESEGMEMLDILAHHPSTAKFISRKLALRFVSDHPPEALIDRMAETFLKKDGDIREVLRTMFNSPEFWDNEAYRSKVKTPLEFVASSLRAAGVEVEDATPLVQFLNRMGMPLYGMQPPTGYSVKAETWVNSSALLARMNFALQLGTGKLPGTSLDPQALLRGNPAPDTGAALAVLENVLLAGDVSTQTHAVIEKRLGDPQITQRKLDDAPVPPNYGAIAGLLMGSPDFQRR